MQALQFRRDTIEKWAAVNPILMDGEVGLIKGSDYLKFGDGVNPWNNLPYANRGPRGYDAVLRWEGTSLGVKSSDQPDFVYKDLKGEKGDSIKGDKGEKGDQGLSIKGDKGDVGVSLHFEWDGTSLGVKREDEVQFIFTELKGAKGDQGNRGYDFGFLWRGTELGVKSSDQQDYSYAQLKGEAGEIGCGLQFMWDGTKLGVKREDQIEYQYVNLKGDKGDQGIQGIQGFSLEFKWMGSLLGIKREDQANYSYEDLRGPKGDIGPSGGMQFKQEWTLGEFYIEGDTVKRGGVPYICTLHHLAIDVTEPGNGSDFKDFWIEVGSMGFPRWKITSEQTVVLRPYEQYVVHGTFENQGNMVIGEGAQVIIIPQP